MNPPGSARLTELVRFGVTGGVCFAIDYGLLYGLTEWAGVHYLLSAAAGFLVSTTVNFVFCMAWVFRGAGRMSVRSVTLFVSSSVAGLVLNQALMWLMVDMLHIHYLISKVFVTGVVMIWNYIMKRRAAYGA